MVERLWRAEQTPVPAEESLADTWKRRLSLAFHEASHANTIRNRGAIPEYVRIKWDGSGAVRAPDGMPDEAFLDVLLSGPLSEVLRNGSASRGCDHDTERARALAVKIAGADGAEALIEARTALLAKELKAGDKAIRQLARDLAYGAGRMSGKTAMVILQSVGT